MGDRFCGSGHIIGDYTWKMRKMKACKVGLIGAILFGVLGAVLGSGIGVVGYGTGMSGTLPFMIIGVIVGFLLFYSVCVSWCKR